ncbi:MAG: hypothetical protein KDI30_09665, partial [Pseudomonadales bacterium]|nr:hypothetical protein [Pseudomonadales bacterium]
MALIGSSLNDFLFFDYITEGNVWTATPYQNCSYRCVYCGVDSQGNSSPHADKHNILDQLDKEFTRISQLPHGPKPASTIVIGACTDPYPPSEQHNCITRELLSFFIKRNIRISILTKSTLILRDMDLLKNYDKVDVCLSICAHDHKLVEHLEPYAPPIEERF